MSSVDVLIVGAGPSGLLLADLLARENVSFLLIDQNESQAKESRALGMQARTLEFWQNIGLIDQFLQNGIKGAGLNLYLNGKKRISLELTDMQRPDTPYPYIFLIPQNETEKILVDDLKARGFEVQRGTALAGFKQNSEGVEAELLANGQKQTVKARYIIGCDGSHSKVREVLGLAFNGESYSSEFIMADAQVNWGLSHDYISVFLGTGAVGVLFPIKGGERSRVLTVRRYANKADEPKTKETTSSPATLPEIEKAFQDIAQQDVKLSHPTWVTKFHVHHRSVEKTRVGRAFLAGDASHIHSPVGAQGMNTGLQDAANLAWKLSAVLKNQSPESLLDTYHQERWPIGQHLLHFTDRAFTMAMTKNKILMSLRNSLIPVIGQILSSFACGKRYMFNFVSELGIRYHENEAVKESVSSQASEIFKKTLPAGRRAPNAKIRNGVELFDLIKGYKFHLLALSRKSLSAEAREAIQKNWSRSKQSSNFQVHWMIEGTDETTSNEIFERFGVTDQGLFLIRPDGYIGYRSDDLEKLT